jgi:hypothetical protein
MYAEGQWKASCDRCGFTFLSSELRTEPRTRLKVCSTCYDPFPKADLPKVARPSQAIPWSRPPLVTHDTRGLMVEDAAGVVWKIYARGGATASDTADGKRARRYILFGATEHGTPLWALSVTTEGVPVVDVYDAAVHGGGPVIPSWPVSDPEGVNYLLALGDDGSTCLTETT